MKVTDYSKLASLIVKYGNLVDIDEVKLRCSISIILENIEKDLLDNYNMEAYHNFRGRVD